MKKNYLLVMLAAGLLAGCSPGLDENLDSTSPTPGNTNSSDTELMAIRLGNGGLVASDVTGRAAVAPENWVNTEVGIFALNKLGTVNWMDNAVTNPTTDDLHCLLNGVKGRIATNAVPNADPQGVSFDGETYYYPRVNSKAYSFYGYHPYVAPTNAAMTIVPDQISCNYTITGQEDILWGKATATQTTGTDGKQYDGYNAAYFRKISPIPGNPKIGFKHLLTQLTFSVKKGADYKTETCGVTEIKLTSVPKNGGLIIASANADNTEGTIAWLGTTIENGTITVPTPPTPPTLDPNADNLTEIFAFKNTNPFVLADSETVLQVPNSVVMLPSGFAKYNLSVMLNGSPTTLEIKPAEGGNFKPGFSYNIALIINGPMPIQIEATLKDWEKGKEIDTEI